MGGGRQKKWEPPINASKQNFLIGVYRRLSAFIRSQSCSCFDPT
jgi:hypothetical protein